MSIKKYNTYFKENGKVYYYDDNGISADVPSSAFGDIDNKIATKLDTSVFSAVSGTFYTTANPSGFIDNTVNDLVNYYTTAQTYTQAEINEMLANFGGFEVVTLTTGENPHPDVSDPSTKIIYLTKDSTSLATDPYTEWIYTESNTWEIIGETTVDLTNYVTFSVLNDTLADYQTTAAMTGYYTKSETSGAIEISDALNGKQDKLTFNYSDTTITGINSSAVGQLLQAGTDLVISDGIIKVNTNGSAQGHYAFVEGYNTHADGHYSHAEGFGTSAVGNYSHAEGYNTRAYNAQSHAEGYYSTANGIAAHAEGYYTLANGYASHAEGYSTTAVGQNAHAEGRGSYASGNYSHAGGYYTIASANYTTVIGKYNSNQSAAFIIGNGSGTNATARSDAFVVEWDGTVSANKFIEANPDPTLTLTGGTFVEVTEDTTNNILTVDLESSLGQMLTELSGVLTAKPATGSRYILGLETNGTLTWLALNQ